MPGHGVEEKRELSDRLRDNLNFTLADYDNPEVRPTPSLHARLITNLI